MDDAGADEAGLALSAAADKRYTATVKLIVGNGVFRAIHRPLADPTDPDAPHAAAALRPGAVLVAFVPTALQVKQLVDALRAHGGFAAVETIETFLRFWHVVERSVRPVHRMVAHTGFLTYGRLLARDT